MRAVLLVAAVAVVSGALAGGFAWGVERILGEVLDAPTAVLVTLPAVGLGVSALVRHFGGPRSGPATTDTYISAYHGTPISLRASAARTGAGAVTVASGVALDPVGPGLLIGASVGAAAARWRRWVGTDLVVVGGAAGIAAALQSPLGAAVMAVELPYRDGINWRRLPLAAAGAAAGFVARGLIDDFELPFRTDIGVVGVRDVLLALALAVGAGFAARAVAWLAGRAQAEIGPMFSSDWQHVLTGAAALMALASMSLAAFDDVPVSLGPGPAALGWAATTSTLGLCALFVVRALASGASVLGRGTGGLFVPLIVLGLIAGHAAGDVFDGNVGMLAMVGAAALLGAGYRIPLAALAWLAESTHSVPAIAVGGVAILVAQAVGAGYSVSTAQRSGPSAAAPTA